MIDRERIIKPKPYIVKDNNLTVIRVEQIKAPIIREGKGYRVYKTKIS